MDYIGSKKKLIPFIDETINKHLSLDNKIVCDLFGGTGIVSEYFKSKNVKKIISNDIQFFSYCRLNAVLLNEKDLNFKGIIKDLKNFEDKVKELSLVFNNLKPKEAYITKTYSPESIKHCEYKRKYFTKENAMKIDACIDFIYKNKDKLTEKEFLYLIASLIESADKVSNVASVYGAYLKKFKKSAEVPFVFAPLKINHSKKIDFEVYNENSNSLIHKIKGDILYIDPPYNTRQYASNYHVLETISTNSQLKVKGVTGLPNWSSKKSDFSSKINVKDAFKDLIKNANFEYVFMSYNDEGILEKDYIIETLKEFYKDVGYEELEYKRFKADKKRKYKSDTVKEYIFYGKKRILD